MTLQAQADATSSPIGGKMSSFGGVKAVSVFFGFDLQNGFVLLIPPGHAMRRLRRINHLPRNWALFRQMPLQAGSAVGA
jgi:hypothetical protein